MPINDIELIIEVIDIIRESHKIEPRDLDRLIFILGAGMGVLTK